MWTCPSCNQQLDTEPTVCPACGYDGSADMLRHPTLSPRHSQPMGKNPENIEVSTQLSEALQQKQLEQYDKAISLMMDAKTIEDYQKAKAAFEALGSYGSSEKYIRNCDSKIRELSPHNLPPEVPDDKEQLKQKYNEAVSLMTEAKTIEDYQKAKAAFEALGSYGSSKAFIHKCEEKISEITEKNPVPPVTGNGNLLWILPALWAVLFGGSFFILQNRYSSEEFYTVWAAAALPVVFIGCFLIDRFKTRIYAAKRGRIALRVAVILTLGALLVMLTLNDHDIFEEKPLLLIAAILAAFLIYFIIDHARGNLFATEKGRVALRIVAILAAVPFLFLSTIYLYNISTDMCRVFAGCPICLVYAYLIRLYPSRDLSIKNPAARKAVKFAAFAVLLASSVAGIVFIESCLGTVSHCFSYNYLLISGNGYVSAGLPALITMVFLLLSIYMPVWGVAGTALGIYTCLLWVQVTNLTAVLPAWCALAVYEICCLIVKHKGKKIRFHRWIGLLAALLYLVPVVTLTDYSDSEKILCLFLCASVTCIALTEPWRRSDIRF